MRKYRIVLGLLISLCILLNTTGCIFKTEYNVFSDEDHSITHISSSIRDYIGIVLDDRELVVCSYKGHEICRKSFEKNIVSIDVYKTKVLLQFEDDSIELYLFEEENMILCVQRSFLSPIKKSEIVGWMDDAGIVVLLENGDLFSSSNLYSPYDLTKIDEHVKTETCLDDYFVYITDEGKVVSFRLGSPYSPSPEVAIEKTNRIIELRLARFDGNDGFLGITTDQVYYLSGIPLRLDTQIDLSKIDIGSVLSGKHMHYSVLYQIDGQWYYEGMKRDYKSDVNHANRRRIKVDQGESVLPIPGGVIFYTEHEVRVQLI